MVTTLTGVNDFARMQELQRLTADFIAQHGEFSVERLDGEEVSTDQMRASIESQPFLTPRKLVILHNPGKQKAFAEAIVDLLAAVSDATDVIIVEPKIDKRSSYYKTLKKDTDFQEYIDLDASGLARWATEYAVQRKGTLALADARQLIDRIGLSQQALKNELDKLIAYNPNITKQSIEQLTERLPQSTVFELLDAAFARNPERALALYKEQRALKVEPQAILAMLAWQLHTLVIVKAGASRSAEEIAKAAKLNPYVVRKSQGLARRLTLEQVKDLVAQLLTIDVRLKRASVDADEITQLFILEIAQT